MKNKPIISIIVPIYNSEKYLDKCLNSILNQTYKNLEILLINDGSTDNSPEICEEYAVRDSRIKVIHKKNEGVSTARNLALQKSTGDFISCIDSDDWLELDAYEQIINCITKYNVDAVLFEYFTVYESGKAVHKSHQELDGLMDNVKAIETTISPVNRFVWSKVFSRKLIKDIQFDTKIHFGEDTLFSSHVLGNAESVFYLSKPLYHYFQSNDSATRMVFNPRMFSGVEAYSHLVELCKTKYPSIVDIAQSAHKNLIVNVLLVLLQNKNLPYYKSKKKELLARLKKDLSGLLLSNKVSFKLKIKFLIGYLCPGLLSEIHNRKI